MGTYGHAARLYFFANFIEPFFNVTLIVTAPFREIEMSASLVDVVDDKPGNWRDIAVPRPTRLV